MRTLIEQLYNNSARLGSRLVVLTVLLAGTALVRPASAGIIINATESNGDVIFAYSGTLDLDTLSTSGASSIRSRVRPSDTTIQFNDPAGNQNAYGAAFSQRPTSNSLGLGFALINATTTLSGTPAFGVFGSQMHLDSTLSAADWLSGQSGSMTFENKTLSDLGFFYDRTHTWVLNTTTQDDITLIVGAAAAAAAVPEPNTTIAMCLLGIVGFVVNRRRRRQVSAA